MKQWAARLSSKGAGTCLSPEDPRAGEASSMTLPCRGGNSVSNQFPATDSLPMRCRNYHDTEKPFPTTLISQSLMEESQLSLEDTRRKTLITYSVNVSFKLAAKEKALTIFANGGALSEPEHIHVLDESDSG